MHVLKIMNVTKTYDGVKKAVDDLNLEVRKGEIFGFIGPNGAGKTTTIKMMTGILAPSNGQIMINGHDIVNSPIDAKMNFTYVPDHPEIFNSISGMDYLNFIADMYEVSIAERKEKIEKFTKTFDIWDALPKPVNSYSHGMKQKLLISGALLPNPNLWILDEPLVGLDPHSAKTLKDLMREHCSNGGTVFFSSHVLEVVENLCDRIGVIHRGKLIACDTLKNIKQQSTSSLEDIFLEMTKHE